VPFEGNLSVDVAIKTENTTQFVYASHRLASKFWEIELARPIVIVDGS